MRKPSHRDIDRPSDIRAGARELLTGRWREAVLLSLVPTIFSMLFLRDVQNGESSSLLYELVEGFLLTGVTFGFMNLVRNRSHILKPLDEMVAPFRRDYFKNLLFLKLWKYLFVALWSLLFLIPGIVKSYSYSQAELLYKDHVDRTGEQPDPRTMIRESARMMDGYKMALFLLDLSFFGWHILNVLTNGILGLWLTPYMSMSRVIFYEILTAGHYTFPETDASDKRLAEKERQAEVGKDPYDFSDFEDF